MTGNKKRTDQNYGGKGKKSHKVLVSSCEQERHVQNGQVGAAAGSLQLDSFHLCFMTYKHPSPKETDTDIHMCKER